MKKTWNVTQASSRRWTRPPTSAWANKAGLSLWEVLVVLVIVALVAVLTWTALTPGHKSRHPISCVSNLKQIGLGLRIYSNDQGDQFPWRGSPPQGAAGLGLVEYFRVASNELSSPKILTCPTDTQRSRVSDWSRLTATNLSYFVGLDADESKPQTILTGDRNLTGGVWTANRVLLVTTNRPVGWDARLHNEMGNVGLADGSAQQCSKITLAAQMGGALLNGSTNWLRLAMPTD